MGKNTEKLSRIIEYVGTFDISQIIANFKKMEQSLEKRHSSKSDILGLDNEIDKLKGIDKVLQKAISKGFKNPKSFSDFERTTNIMISSISKLNNEFKKIDKESLAYALKRAEGSAKSLEREVNTLEEKLQKNMQTLLKGADGAENITKAINENIKKAKEEKVALNNINRLIQQSLDKQNEKVNKTKEEIKMAEQLKETYEAQKKTVQDLSSVNIFEGEAKNGSNKNFKRSFLNKGNYSVIGGGAVSDENLSSATQVISEILNDKQIPTIAKTKKALSGVNLELNGIENKINLLVAAWQVYQNKITIAGDGEKAQISRLKELNSTLQEQQNIQSNLTTALSSQRGNISSNYSTLINTIGNSNVAQGKVRDVQKLQSVELPGLENNRKALQRLDDTLAENAEKTKTAINSQKELDSTFDQLGNRLKYIFSFMNMYYVALRQIRQTFNDIQKIDKAFAEIAMVTDKTIDDMWGQYDDYAKIANELGQTTESVIKSSALYYQQGLSASEALTLTKDTMKLATLANIDFKESTKLMTAALRSFHMEMEEGSHVTDVYSELAAHAAANVQDIAYAMSKTSSIAASAGMKFENLSAMLTTMIESTQEAPIT